mmetsp:Transcript_57574/g.145996  ORF Transcript_57574/g.145996 Transcript_57574/m.145996 type:complete len:260 (-) Transcript_57574:989-1768(-)
MRQRDAVQPALLLRKCGEVNRLGGAVQAQAPIDKLFRLYRARLLRIQHMEQLLGVLLVDVQGVEEHLHVRVLELRLELRPRHPLAVALEEHRPNLLQQKPALLLLSALQRAVDEDACEDVHQRKGNEGDVHAERHRHKRRDLDHEWSEHFTPFLAVRDGLKEGQHGRGQRAVVLLEVLQTGSGSDLVVRHALREEHAHNVHQQDEQRHRPIEGARSLADGDHDGLKLPVDVNDAQHTDNAHEAADAQHAQDTCAVAVRG